MSKDLVLVFDFDGTLADSMNSWVETLNRLAEKYGYKRITKQNLHKLRNSSSNDALLILKISKFKLPFVVNEARKLLNEKVQDWKPILGIKEALESLKKAGYTTGILTSNSKENTESFLKKNRLELFDFVYSGTSVFGKDKVIKQLLKNFNLDPVRVIYIGDETRDVEAEKNAGVRVAAVTWGFNTKPILKKTRPDFLIETPAALLRLVSPQNFE